LSSASGVPTERTGIPGCWVIFFEHAVHQDLAEVAAILCHRVMVDDVVFWNSEPLDPRD
jgi:hypothetical protein